MQDKVLQQHFTDFPPSEFWRLFIDANRHTVGPLGFDAQEPGYLKSLQSAFDYAIKRMNQPLTANFLIELHDQSIRYTKTIYTTSETVKDDVVIVKIAQNFDPGLRNHGTEFAINAKDDNKNITRAGLAEILHKIANGERFLLNITYRSERPGDFFRTANIPKPLTDDHINQIYHRLMTEEIDQASLGVPSESSESLKTKMNLLISNYYAAISKAVSADQKLHAIATLVHELEINHPFTDGNCRTFVLELLPILLMQQGFPPSLVTNPNRFDLFSIDELVQEIKDGFQRFNNLKTAASPPVPGHESDVLLYINETTATLLAINAVKELPHWKEINSAEKNQAVEVINKCLLTSIFKKTLTYDEVNATLLTIRSTVHEAIYRSPMLFTIFGPQNEYGIYFDSLMNQAFGRKALNVAGLSANLNSVLNPPAIPSPAPKSP